MFSALRSTVARSTRGFSTTVGRRDMAKLTLIGNLVREPETRMTKKDKEYVIYTVVTSFVSGVDANGDRQYSSSYHRVLSFNDFASSHLKTLRKGSKVYVEASYDMREPEPGSDPSTPQGQRQVFLKHETIKVVAGPSTKNNSSSEQSAQLSGSETSSLESADRW